MRLPDARADFRRIEAGENNHSGSIFIDEFDALANGRFLQFQMLENFPDDGLDWTVDAFMVSDLRVANLVPHNLATSCLQPRHGDEPSRFRSPGPRAK